MSRQLFRPLVGVCDIGGTTLRVALADEEGKIVARRSEPHQTTDAQAVIEKTAREISALADAHGGVLSGVGAAVPGPLDFRRGWIHFSPNLGWRDVGFAADLSARLHLPVVLDDDANCAALGEKWLGAGIEANDFVYLIIGTGIGGGLVLNGALYRGATGGAGEIGHGTLVPDGPLCSCGNHGCLEALAAGPAIARRANELMPGERLTAQMVIERARTGEGTARHVINEAGYYLGIGLANVVNLLNPEVIAIGGGVALDAGELLLAPARTEMRRRAFASSADAVRVELAQLGDDAGLIGAARLIWDHLRR